jgi:hypothetical protein
MHLLGLLQRCNFPELLRRSSMIRCFDFSGLVEDFERDAGRTLIARGSKKDEGKRAKVRFEKEGTHLWRGETR